MHNSCTSCAEISSVCWGDLPFLMTLFRGEGGGECVCVFSSIIKNLTDRVCAAEAVATATGERAAAKAVQYMVENDTLSLRMK